MHEYLQTAIKKLEDGRKAVTGNKEQAMAGPVAEALREFCSQNDEFAQAVAQGGSFAACMTAVAKDAGQAISDLEAYRKAVRFYFRGADVRVTMTIDVEGAWRQDQEDAGDEEPRAEQDGAAGETGTGGIVLDLSSFL